jgi:tetratricopeptide (TPR) repeat protein
VQRTDAHRIDPQRPEFEHSRATLAFVLRASGRPDEAMRLLLEAQPRLHVALREDHPSRIWNTFQQGRCHLDSGRYEAARDLLTRAADLRRNRKPADPHRTAQIVLRLADAYAGLGETGKATELYTETLECFTQARMTQHPEAREAAASVERLRAIEGRVRAA